MIYKGSRYENIPVYVFYKDTSNRKDYTISTSSGNKDTLIPTLRRRGLHKFTSNEAFVHIFQKGDRIDLLSYRYYGDAQLWWVIMDANPKYMTPWDIPIGANLYIPAYNATQEGDI